MIAAVQAPLRSHGTGGQQCRYGFGLHLAQARFRARVVDQAGAADRAVVVVVAHSGYPVEADRPAADIEATGTPDTLGAIVEEVLAGAGPVDALAAGAGIAAEAAMRCIRGQIDACALAARFLAATATALLLADALLAALLLLAFAFLADGLPEWADSERGSDRDCSGQTNSPARPRIKSRSVHDNLLVALPR